MMARASAIKYAGQREKPTRLLDLTVRFGIDFLTLAPVPRDKLQDLRRKSTVHWNGVFETSADEDQEAESSSSSDESGLSVDWDPREESQGMPATNTDAYTVAVTRHVENLLHESNENLNSKNSLDEAPGKFWWPCQELWRLGYQMKTR